MLAPGWRGEQWGLYECIPLNVDDLIWAHPTNLIDNAAVIFGTTMSLEIKRGGPVYLTKAQIAVGYHQLVVPRGRTGNDFAKRIHDNGAAEHWVPIFDPRFRDGHAEAIILIAACLYDDVGVQHLQMGGLHMVNVKVCDRCVVANHHDVDLLHTEFSPGFRPTSIVA